MNCESLRGLLDESTIRRLNEVAHDLAQSDDFHDPIAWRKAIPSLAAIDLPHHLGGTPLSVVQMMSIFRTFGRLSLDLRDVPGLGHGRMLNLPACGDRFSSTLLNVASGESFIAICITEESSGTDLRALKTTATRTLNGYELSGEKCFVARLQQADAFIVFARVAEKQETQDKLTAFLIDAQTPGLSIRDIPSLGLNGISWGALRLDRVFVPCARRIGAERRGSVLFSEHFSYWRCAMAAAATGAAESALDKAKERLHSRTVFAAPIGRFSHLQQQYAIHAARLHMAWLLIVDAAARIDSNEDCYVDSAMAKAETVEICIDAVQWSMHIHGAYGYSLTAGLEKPLRDLLGLRIADGTTDVLRSQVARGLLGEDLYTQQIGRSTTRTPTSERRLW